MSKIAVRVLVTLLAIIAIASSVIAVLKMIPSKQRYPIASSDMQVSTTEISEPSDPPVEVARNVILILADGMGPSYVEAARLTSVGRNSQLEMQKLPVRGMVSTRSADDLVTDSAAAATAIATGVKTNNGSIAVDPEGKPLRTILEAAESAGFVTGLVTTTDVSDATPAAFAAHAESRRERDEIASQLVASGVEILMGSNAKHFVPVSHWGGRRTDGTDLLEKARADGTTVARKLGELRAAASLPVIAIFEENDRPPLPDLALESLRLLDTSDRRFFLMIESEQVDSAAHDNDLGRTLSAVREIDQTVKRVVDWAKEDGSTIVVVTADHDTGGMQFIPSDSSKYIHVIWPTSKHTAQDVNLYAFGPGVEAFDRFIDNTDIAPILARLLGIEFQAR